MITEQQDIINEQNAVFFDEIPEGSDVDNYINSDVNKWARDTRINSSPVGYKVTAEFPANVGFSDANDYVSFTFLIATTRGNDSSTKTQQTKTNKTLHNDSKQLFQGAVDVASSAASKLGEVLPDLLKKYTSAASKAISDVGTATVDGSFTPMVYSQAKDYVNLMMPNNIEFSDNASWSTVDSSPSMMGTLLNVGSTYMDNSDAGKNKVKSIGLYEINKIVSNILYEQGEGVTSSYQGKLLNRYTSQAFNGMERRSFNFSWSLIPKNIVEYESIQLIIKLFRQNSYPDISNDGYFLIYPNRVNINFKTFGNSENNQLPKIATCIIKNVSVNYTPNQQWSTIDHAGIPGAASQCNLSVSFEEIVPLTQKDIKEGNY